MEGENNDRGGGVRVYLGRSDELAQSREKAGHAQRGAYRHDNHSHQRHQRVEEREIEKPGVL